MGSNVFGDVSILISLDDDCNANNEHQIREDFVGSNCMSMNRSPQKTFTSEFYQLLPSYGIEAKATTIKIIYR